MIIDYSVRLIVIDSFCGAGGVTEGFHRAVDEQGNKICRVIIGINHDEVAIKSHAANHPDTIHFVEDFILRRKAAPCPGDHLHDAGA
ncbi:MAG: hypothetical protein VB046_08190 [Paludibacter sp.]|nr:hypothetical protein [Paludibacter sp.]